MLLFDNRSQDTKNMLSTNTKNLISYSHIHCHLLHGLDMWRNSAERRYLNKIPKTPKIQNKQFITNSKETQNNNHTQKILTMKQLIELLNRAM